MIEVDILYQPCYNSCHMYKLLNVKGYKFNLKLAFSKTNLQSHMYWIFKVLKLDIWDFIMNLENLLNLYK